MITFSLRIALEKPQQLKLALIDLQGKIVWESSQNQLLQGINDFILPNKQPQLGHLCIQSTRH
jgi:hypothetical protein